MFLHDEHVAAWLQALTDKEFIEFFYKHLAARRIEGDGASRIDTRLVLGEARRFVDHTGRMRPWTVELLCSSPHESRADAPIKWRGECCGFQTGSWRRFATCPLCAGEVQDA